MTTRKITPRLYSIENDELPTGHRFACFEDLTRFVDFVVKSGVMQNLNPGAPCKVIVKCNGDHDYSEAVMPNTIWIAKTHWEPSIVLHELAHITLQDGAHSRDFLYTYLRLVRAFLGEVYYDLYLAAFQREKLIPL